MKYGTIYTLPFKSRKEISYTVEVQKENYEGRPLELTGGGSPFSIEIDDEDFLYTPARFSTATIRVVGDDYLQSLYSTGYQQYRVNLKRENAVAWTGFVRPELYTQDYTSTIFELEVECMSALSTLEYIDYKQAGEGSRVFISLWDLLKKCIMSSNGLYESVYIPHVYASSESDYKSGVNVLQNMKVSEQNFFDEDDKPMKLKEVLEEICKLLNWTICDWKGSLYFIDIDHTGEFYKYSADLETKIGSVTPNLLNVQKIGFAGSGHSYDKLTGRNKVIVKTSNYPVGGLIPEEKFEPKEMYGSYKGINNDRYTEEIYVQGMILDSWKLKAYGEDFPLGSGNIYELTDEQVKIAGVWLNYNGRMGATAYKVGIADAERSGDGYKVTGANYSWKTLIRYKIASRIVDKPILIAKGAVAPYSQGAIGIEAGILFTTNYAEPHKVKITDSHVLRFSLRIGGEYWNGASWQTSEATFDVGIGEIGKEVERTSTRGTKTADMPYDGLTGYIIQFPDDRTLIGELEIVMYAVEYPYQMDKRISLVDIENLRLTYQKKDNKIDEGDNSDRTYENIVNESFINELDEIEFKISSYNNDGACYSKVMLGNNYLKDNLYSAIENKLVRPEEHLIRRIIKQYGATKNKLTQILLNNESITPISRLSDNHKPDKYFIVTGGAIDFSMDQFECIMIEV